MDWSRLIESLYNSGPGAIIAALLLIGIYRLANRFGGDFITSQRLLAEASGRQAQSMDGLRTAIESFVNRDDTAHREMLVLLKYIAQYQEDFVTTAREHREIHSNGTCNGDTN